MLSVYTNSEPAIIAKILQNRRMETAFQLRLATDEDVAALHGLIEASVRGLCSGPPKTTGPGRRGRETSDYTPAQIEGALGTVLGLDTQLIRDQTYFIAEVFGQNAKAQKRMAGCGGWSKRKTLFGADQGPGREPELLDPAVDAAKVRAIFVHPEFARQGLGSLILAMVEQAARAAGFKRLNWDRR